jgi:hypothetical protein
MVRDPGQEQLRLAAVAALDDAESLLRRTDLSVDHEDGWTPDFAEKLADGIAACRWFVGMSFQTPGNFGYWLFRITEGRISMQSSHKQLDDAVSKASGALYEREKERDRQRSERQGDADRTS